MGTWFLALLVAFGIAARTATIVAQTREFRALTVQASIDAQEGNYGNEGLIPQSRYLLLAGSS